MSQGAQIFQKRRRPRACFGLSDRRGARAGGGDRRRAHGSTGLPSRPSLTDHTQDLLARAVGSQLTRAQIVPRAAEKLLRLAAWGMNSSLLGAYIIQPHAKDGAHDCRALVRPAARAVPEKSVHIPQWRILHCDWLEDFVRHHVAQLAAGRARTTRSLTIGIVSRMRLVAARAHPTPGGAPATWCAPRSRPAATHRA